MLSKVASQLSKKGSTTDSHLQRERAQQTRELIHVVGWCQRTLASLLDGAAHQAKREPTRLKPQQGICMHVQNLMVCTNLLWPAFLNELQHCASVSIHFASGLVKSIHLERLENGVTFFNMNHGTFAGGLHTEIQL